MKANRRHFFKAALAGSAAVLPSCERATSFLSAQLGETVPPELPLPDGEQIDPDFHLLSRAAFGAWPGELAQLKKQGRDAWLEEQLNHEEINDSACDLRAEW